MLKTDIHVDINKSIFLRTQNKLILRNKELCFSLNCAYYFFGHKATTAIGQVRFSQP